MRAVLLHRDHLLLVNAWPASTGSDLWCAPGGGVAPHASLPDNLIREVHEETGLTVEVGEPCLVNEFHDPDGDYHQVEVFFRCALRDGTLREDWRDPERIVERRGWFDRDAARALHLRPASLPAVAWGAADAPAYDPLERLTR